MYKKVLAFVVALIVAVIALKPYVSVSVDDFGIGLFVRDSIHHKYTPHVLVQWHR